ncbi:BglG family transcription antiterminator [Streptococcus devriesei]|uniref:BglG family transcription antiterminator n=1 Tax=Streptococcus devriesei TaxID=231233 RepID=UPI000408E875|nr:PTS sugar transporter subunit IIA [Streptococcus devriesei]
MIDQRTRRVIEKLIEKNCISKNTLLSKLSLTSNQLNYAIEKLNAIFIENHKPVIQIKNDLIFLSSQSSQFSIDFLQNDKIFKNYDLNTAERKRYILFMLYYYVNDFLSVNHFLSSMSISKSTFMNDLKKLEDDLKQKSIKIEYSRKIGYHLVGLESEIRYYVLECILKDLNTQELDFFYRYFVVNEKILCKDNLRLKITKLLKKYGLQLPESRSNELYYSILLNIPRMTAKGLFQYDEADLALIKELKEYQLSGELLKELNIENQYAQMFVASLILSSGNGDPHAHFSDQGLIHFVADQCLMRFESIMGIEIDNKKFVYEQLYTHIRPAFYRVLFDLPTVNVLHEKIVQEYYHIYQITKEVMQFFKPIFGKEIPEQEVSFITLYFAIILQDYSLKATHYKAVIVCQSGIGSSVILEKELKTLFPAIIFLGPYSVSDLMQLQEEFQLIFTTVSNLQFAKFHKPVYKVNPVMTDEERAQLVRDVNGNESLRTRDLQSLMTIIRSHTKITDEQSLEKELTRFMSQQSSAELPFEVKKVSKTLGLMELLRAENILVQKNKVSWQKSVKHLGDILYQTDCIEHSYTNTIMDHLHQYGPFMVISEGVALLHAKPEDGVKKLGVALSVFQNDLDFLGRSVSLLFMLAAVDTYQHIGVIENIIKICESESLLRDLKKCRTNLEVYHTLQEFLSVNDKGIFKTADI